MIYPVIKRRESCALGSVRAREKEEEREREKLIRVCPVGMDSVIRCQETATLSTFGLDAPLKMFLFLCVFGISIYQDYRTALQPSMSLFSL